MTTHVPADEIGEVAFGSFAELVVMRGFLADDEASAAVAGIEPFGGGDGGAAGAVEADAGAHLDEGSALRELGGVFVVDADQGHALVILEFVHRADGDSVAGSGLSDGTPVVGGQKDKAEDEHGSQNDGGENEEGFLHAFG